MSSWWLTVTCVTSGSTYTVQVYKLRYQDMVVVLCSYSVSIDCGYTYIWADRRGLSVTGQGARVVKQLVSPLRYSGRNVVADNFVDLLILQNSYVQIKRLCWYIP